MDVLTKEQRTYCMSRIKNRDTSPEIQLRKALWHLGLRFRLRSCVLGKPDIVFPKLRLAVFVDGCFWHGCPIHANTPATNTSFWVAKLTRTRLRDKHVTESLLSDKWAVIRMWEHEITDDLDGAALRVKRIAARLKRRQEKSTTIDGYLT